MSGGATRRTLLGAASRGLALALLATLVACTALEGPRREAAPGETTPEAPAQEGEPSAAGALARPRSEPAGATQALLAEARAARAAGSYSQASATIERALRIAPSDPQLWVELGEIELASGDPAQAATLARKALTLATDDSAVIADAQRLLRAAGGR
jgi:Flp pilus assembly protein TadD